MAANKINFEYFDPYHSQQYQFVPVPMALLSDYRFKDLSNEAKILYSLMLNRVGLSKENNWLDEEGHVYIIYTVEQAAEILNKGRDTAMKAMAELDTKKGIGLIERIRQGRGKPDRIYVKDFFLKQEVEKFDPEEVEIIDLQKSEKSTSGSRRNQPQEVEKTDPSKNNINQTESKKTDPIYPSSEERTSSDPRMDGMDEICMYTDLVKKNIGYETFAKSGQALNLVLVDEIVKEIVEILCSKQAMMRIGDAEYPLALVKKRMLELRFDHIEYVLECLQTATRKKEIGNIKAYRLKTLFNAPDTIQSYYLAKANFDRYAGGVG